MQKKKMRKKSRNGFLLWFGNLHILAKVFFLGFILLSGFFLLRVITHVGATSNLEVYTTPPNATASAQFTMTANGTPIFVETYQGMNYARFGFSGSAAITIQTTQPVASSSVSPENYHVATQVNGNTLSFTLNNPSKLIVTINNIPLFVFADPIEVTPPQLGDANVVDVMHYVTDNTGATLQTNQIQSAIDATAQLNNGLGGILYFPNGKYLTGSLLIKSNVAVYLQSGALIQGSSNPADYPERDNAQAIFLAFDGSSNAKIFGRGIIDGSGTILRSPAANNQSVFTIETLHNAKNIEVQDVLLRNNASWAFHILNSDTVNAENLKIINDGTVMYLDGVDPDSSTNVTVDGQFTYTTDDCNAIKSETYYGAVQPVSGITIKNGICWTSSAGMKVGAGVASTANNITFQNNAIIHANRAIFVSNQKGGVINNITYSNNWAESGVAKLVDLSIIPLTGYSGGTISGVMITNFTADEFGFSLPGDYNPYHWYESIPDSLIAGLDGSHEVSQVTVNNFVVAGTAYTTPSSAKFYLNSYTSNIVFTTPTPTSTPTPTPTPLPYYKQVLQDGATGYFRLADINSTASDTGSSGQTGTYKNSPLQSQLGALVPSGDTNTSVLFNGSNQYVDIPYNTNLTNYASFSIEAWAYVTGGSGKYRGIVADRKYPDGLVLYANSSNQWAFWINNGTGMSVLNGPALAYKTWVYLVGTYDSNAKVATFYVNGQKVASASISSYTRNPQAHEAIGQGEPGSNFFFPGKVDEVAFYSKVLSSSQILSHYRAAGY